MYVVSQFGVWHLSSIVLLLTYEKMQGYLRGRWGQGCCHQCWQDWVICHGSRKIQETWLKCINARYVCDSLCVLTYITWIRQVFDCMTVCSSQQRYWRLVVPVEGSVADSNYALKSALQDRSRHTRTWHQSNGPIFSRWDWNDFML